MGGKDQRQWGSLLLPVNLPLGPILRPPKHCSSLWEARRKLGLAALSLCTSESFWCQPHGHSTLFVSQTLKRRLALHLCHQLSRSAKGGITLRMAWGRRVLMWCTYTCRQNAHPDKTLKYKKRSINVMQFLKNVIDFPLKIQKIIKFI